MSEPRDIPIKSYDWKSNAGSYRNVPIAFDDKRYDDPLVPISSFEVAGNSFYGNEDGNNWPYNRRIEGSLEAIWCRRLVAEKLVNVNSWLRSHGVELYVWDAYRPIRCQIGLWKFFWNQAQLNWPGASPEKIESEVLKYVSDPSGFDINNPTTWPVHSSGGAVDVTLRSLSSGKLLDMGARFDEMNEVSHSAFYEAISSTENAKEISLIKGNRRLLHWAMAKEGFVNYPLEFWHFDWGDQMYVHNGGAMGLIGAKAAWYGYVDSPENDGK